nr:hypothetical protein B0A51_06910 [Rachicladosporium sp. CCFEE 5018]
MDALSGGPPLWTDLHSLNFYSTALIAISDETLSYESARKQLFDPFERYKHLTTPPDAMLQDPHGHLESFATWQAQAFADTDARKLLHEQARHIILNSAAMSAVMRIPSPPAAESSESSDEDEATGDAVTRIGSPPASQRSLDADDANNALVNEGGGERHATSSTLPAMKAQDHAARSSEDTSSGKARQLCDRDAEPASLQESRQDANRLAAIPTIFRPGNTYGISRHSVKAKGAAAIAPDHALQKLGTSVTRTTRLPLIDRRSMARSETMIPTRIDPDAKRANPAFQPHRSDGFLEASNGQILYTSLICALQHQPGGIVLFGGGVYDQKKGPMDCGNAQCRFGHDKLSHRHQLALVEVKRGKGFGKELGYPKGKLLQLVERQ